MYLQNGTLNGCVEKQIRDEIDTYMESLLQAYVIEEKEVDLEILVCRLVEQARVFARFSDIYMSEIKRYTDAIKTPVKFDPLVLKDLKDAAEHSSAVLARLRLLQHIY
tara:strand:+ start:247 stop:570 length:324 start_codon:yes stop_codon:yes gene_type:complete